jgi:hypothetical protein
VVEVVGVGRVHEPGEPQHVLDALADTLDDMPELDAVRPYPVSSPEDAAFAA